jgi:hypothetical protein
MVTNLHTNSHNFVDFQCLMEIWSLIFFQFLRKLYQFHFLIILITDGTGLFDSFYLVVFISNLQKKKHECVHLHLVLYNQIYLFFILFHMDCDHIPTKLFLVQVLSFWDQIYVILGHPESR